jgi:flagellum-specific ATP synthase
VAGSNARIDFAVKMIDRLNAYLRQGVDETVSFPDSAAQLHALFGKA